MIRDITIGQYYKAKSVIHKLDPRLKLVCTLLFLISLFLTRSVMTYLLATLWLIIVIKTSKVPFRFVIRGLKAIVILLLVTALLTGCGSSGESADPGSVPADEQPAEIEPTNAVEPLPDRNFGGQTVTALIRTEWAYEFLPDEGGSDTVVSDAIRERNNR
ncbi:MAG: hypothetical protein IIY86_04055, partial [Lachnospiraceae bacterium]|nr:hypothetical protein [Lachnospiraceae bacterium]